MMNRDHSQDNNSNYERQNDIHRPQIPHPYGLSSQPKGMYNKVKPDLKRHYPEMWGRFLDNHYDPQIHGQPFVVAMKTPD